MQRSAASRAANLSARSTTSSCTSAVSTLPLLSLYFPPSLTFRTVSYFVLIISVESFFLKTIFSMFSQPDSCRNTPIRLSQSPYCAISHSAWILNSFIQESCTVTDNSWRHESAIQHTTPCALISFKKPIILSSFTGARWRSDYGTTLQTGRSPVRFPMVSVEFFSDIILLVALWPWVWLSL
jgi:hypothetical protein